MHRFYDAGQQAGIWYVNFERPAAGTPTGYDACDLCIDLVVAPDLASHQWKDEDEYAVGRKAGFISDGQHDSVERARTTVLRLLASRLGPFAGDWSFWRRDADWTTPVLPASPQPRDRKDASTGIVAAAGVDQAQAGADAELAIARYQEPPARFSVAITRKKAAHA